METVAGQHFRRSGGEVFRLKTPVVADDNTAGFALRFQIIGKPLRTATNIGKGVIIADPPAPTICAKLNITH
jgi:hypothetical protein